jgi:hypothetical protein
MAIVVGLLSQEERARYATKEQIALLFGVTDRTVANWVRRWKDSHRVRLYYEPTTRGPRLKVHLDDVLEFGRDHRLDFSNEFRSYMSGFDYDPTDPGKRDEEIWGAVTQKGGLDPSRLSDLTRHR